MLTTTDVGFAIRDFLEGNSISMLRLKDDEWIETGDRVHISFVDISDASNPIIHTESGQRLTIRIIR